MAKIMSKQDDLSKLEIAIKDAELRLEVFNRNIGVIQKEIELLLAVQKQLEENIVQLKKPKVTAMAIEYKKAKEEFKKTKVRLSYLNIDKSANEKAYLEVKFSLEKAQETYKELEKKGENNVIHGKFGKNRV
jgi:hypothetical protein